MNERSPVRLGAGVRQRRGALRLAAGAATLAAVGLAAGALLLSVL